jgi:hypothetical protein
LAEGWWHRFSTCKASLEIVIAAANEMYNEARCSQKLGFRFSSGYQLLNMNGTFKRLMVDTGLLKNAEVQNRSLHSWSHTYATLKLLGNKTEIHTLSKQKGISAAIIKRHRNKLTATI